MANTTLLCGNCLELLKEVPDNSVDMVLTDPPYSSGGLFPGARKLPTRAKYTDTGFNGASRFKDFSGDNMDQRSFTLFMQMVLAMARDKMKPGTVAAVFCDWRQLPSMTDALQMAGLIYRGIVVWDKGNSRATPGRFRNDCEYIVWGTNGQRPAKFEKGCQVFPGCYRVKSVRTLAKYHQTEKPVELLEYLLQVIPEGGIALDMFMGSGSTGVAAVNTGRNFIGMELDRDYFTVAQKRIEDAAAQLQAAGC